MKPKGEGPVGSVISDPVLLDRYVAIADYVKQETNHCSLEAGQVVEVVEKNQHGGWVQRGGWWVGPAWWVVGESSMVGGGWVQRGGWWVGPAWWVVGGSSMVGGGWVQRGGWGGS